MADHDYHPNDHQRKHYNPTSNFPHHRFISETASCGSPDSPHDLHYPTNYTSHSPPPVIDSSQGGQSDALPRSLSQQSSYSKIQTTPTQSPNRNNTPTPSDTSIESSSQLPTGFAAYPANSRHRCYGFRIETWFYTSLGTLLCLVTIRIIDSVLSKTECDSSYVLWYTVAFDGAQVLAIAAAAYATYSANSRLIACYILFQVAGAALNGFLIVQYILSRPTMPDPNAKLPNCADSTIIILHSQSKVPNFCLLVLNGAFSIITMVLAALCSRLAFLQNSSHLKRPVQKTQTGQPAKTPKCGVASAPLLDTSAIEQNWAADPSLNSLGSS